VTAYASLSVSEAIRQVVAGAAAGRCTEG
jgi:hypothetical protein